MVNDKEKAISGLNFCNNDANFSKATIFAIECISANIFGWLFLQG